MARTPSSTVTELESLIGQRGQVSINSNNRALVQKWLTANGVRAVVAKALILENLASVYNDLSDSQLDFYQSQEPSQTKEEEPSMKIGETLVGGQNVQEALAVLANALNAGQKKPEASINENDVARIAKKLIESHISKPISVTIKDTTTTIPAGEHRHKIFETVLKAVVCGNVAIVGAAGSGKTTLAEQVAQALNVPFYFCGAIASEYKLTGFIDAHTTL